MMICLVGGQGIGKSTLFRLLAIKDEWFSDDIRRLDDDNIFRRLYGHWIIEIWKNCKQAGLRKNVLFIGFSGDL